MPLISISDDQRKPIPHANFIEAIPHGIPADLHQPSFAQGHYLAFLGRISPEKRPDRAIRIARQAGLRLKIAAKVNAEERFYFENEIEPLLGDGIEFVGEINESRKNDFLRNAGALLFPIDWPEPFGLAMIEAMACGTPVIAFRRGSVPEIVEEGVTGTIVDSESEAIASLHDVLAYDRRRVRQRFEERFSASTMADRYVSAYQSCLLQETKEAIFAYPVFKTAADLQATPALAMPISPVALTGVPEVAP
jgi:glycosyltransferase involved in cell wall biosynthesis